VKNCIFIQQYAAKKKIGVGEMANDREIVRNEIRCLLKISIDASKEDREVIRNINIRLLELYLL